MFDIIIPQSRGQLPCLHLLFSPRSFKSPLSTLFFYFCRYSYTPPSSNLDPIRILVRKYLTNSSFQNYAQRRFVFQYLSVINILTLHAMFSAWFWEKYDIHSYFICSFKFLAQISFLKLFIYHSHQILIMSYPTMSNRCSRYVTVLSITFVQVELLTYHLSRIPGSFSEFKMGNSERKAEKETLF
jgi:hypothetical protein